MSEKELPAGWATATLGDLLREPLRNGHSARSTAEPDGVRTLTLSAVTRGEFSDKYTKITSADPDRVGDLWLEPGDILIQRSNTPDLVGTAALFDGDKGWAIYPDLLIRVRVESFVLPKFLAHMLNSRRARAYFKAHAKGLAGSMPKIDQAVIAGFSIPLPPLAEQHRIVEALEAQLSRLDAAVVNVVRCGLRIPRLDGAVRNLLVGSRSEAEELPRGWRWGQLGDVLDRIEAGKSFRCEPRPATSREWGVVKVSAMTWGEFRESEQKAVPEGYSFDPRHEINEGDILVSRANTSEYVGAPVIVKQTRPRLLLSDKSLRLVPASNVDHAWLVTVLASPHVRQQISDRATGTKESMRNISQRGLAEVRIPIPPSSEQASIAEEAEAYLQGTSYLSTAVQKARARSQHLRAALLNRAFAGGLVPQDPTDPPAAELLAQIQAERTAQPKLQRARRTKAAVAPVAAPEPTEAPATAVQQEFEL